MREVMFKFKIPELTVEHPTELFSKIKLLNISTYYLITKELQSYVPMYVHITKIYNNLLENKL